MRTHMLALALTAAITSVMGPVACQAAQVASDIRIAAIAAGRLYVVGTTERPHTPVSLESRFTTESDETGKFQYELVYHPARCIVTAEIEGKTHEAVVSNCGQQVLVGTPGIAARPPAALPVQTGTLSSPAAASSKLKKTPSPPAALQASRTAIRAHALAHREPIHAVRFERRKSIIKPKIEQQEPATDEMPLAD